MAQSTKCLKNFRMKCLYLCNIKTHEKTRDEVSKELLSAGEILSILFGVSVGEMRSMLRYGPNTQALATLEALIIVKRESKMTEFLGL